MEGWIAEEGQLHTYLIVVGLSRVNGKGIQLYKCKEFHHIKCDCHRLKKKNKDYITITKYIKTPIAIHGNSAFYTQINNHLINKKERIQ
jgi:hypothetical protein